MASYIQGVTDVITPLPAYTPDFGFLERQLRRKDQMYEQGYAQVKSAYSQVLNAALTNADNISVRSAYVKSAEEKLKNLASTDLSLQENVQAAENVFSPFWEDQDLLTDFAKTRQMNSETSKAMALRDSSDKEERERFWQDGLNYVDLTRKELQMAKRGDGSLGRVQVRSYVPYVNVEKEMTAELEKMGYKDGLKMSFTKDGYIHTFTNGDGSKATYEDVVARMINMHPEWRDVFKVKGTNQFYGAVLNHMQTFGSDEATARKEVASGYQQTQIKEADSKIKLSKEAIDAANSELTKIDGLYSDKARSGTITQQELMDWSNKRNAVKSAEATRDYYTNYKKEFEGNDFLEQLSKSGGGEGYFARGFEMSFIRDYARVRASAVQQEIHSDPTYVAAQTQANQRYLNEQRLNDNQWVDTDGDGVADAKIGSTVDANGNVISTASGSLKQKAAKGVTEQQQLDTPTVGGVYGKQDSKTYRTSYYNNFKSTVMEKGSSFTKGGADFVSSVAGFVGNYPGLNNYLKYLTSLVNGDNATLASLKEKDMKVIFEKLKADKVIGESIPGYNNSPSMQLKSLVDAADKYVKDKGLDYSQVQRDSYLRYLQDGRTFYHGTQLLKEFEGEILQKDPTLQKLKIFSTAKGFVPEEEWVEKETPKEYFDYQNRFNPTWKQYSASEREKLKEGNRKIYREALDKVNAHLSTYAAKTVGDNGETVEQAIMSKELNFATNNDENLDVAQKITTSVLSQPNPQVLAGGVLKPLNYDRLSDIAGDDDDLQQMIGWLTESGGTNLNKVISQTGIAMAGRNGNAVARFYIDASKLKSAVSGTKFEKKYEKAITALSQVGLEFDMDRNNYRNFAMDNYLPKAIEQKAIEQGIRASDWEKNNLHYDYTVQSGNDGGYMVTMSLKTINPQTGQESWKNSEESILFPKGYPLNEIMKEVHELGFNNYRAVSGYYKQKRQSADPVNNPMLMQPGETPDQYFARIQNQSQK